MNLRGNVQHIPSQNGGGVVGWQAMKDGNPSLLVVSCFFFGLWGLERKSHSRYFWAWFKMQCACNSCWDITVHMQLLLNQSTTHLTSPSLKNISTCLVNLLFASYSKQFGLVNGDAKFVLIPRNECQSLPSNIHWPWINHTIYYCFISLHHLHLVGLVCWFQSKTMLLHKPHCLVWHIIIYWQIMTSDQELLNKIENVIL